ncbi:hypothetical protein ACFX12_009862 [Malus domestica]
MPNAWELHSNQKISSSSTHNPEYPQGRHPYRLQPHPRKDMKHFDRKPTNLEYPQPKSDVRSILLDPTIGALSGLHPGGILVDMTTSEPSLAIWARSQKNCLLGHVSFSADTRQHGGPNVPASSLSLHS